MKMVVMCELQTRIWCYRICVLVFVFSVLMTMIVQIWNYYFSLVNEMDLMLERSPQLSGIVEMCAKNLTFEWNMSCSALESKWMCRLPTSNVYIDYRTVSDTVSDNVVVDRINSSIEISPLDACVKVMVWILPW